MRALSTPRQPSAAAPPWRERWPRAHGELSSAHLHLQVFRPQETCVPRASTRSTYVFGAALQRSRQGSMATHTCACPPPQVNARQCATLPIARSSPRGCGDRTRGQRILHNHGLSSESASLRPSTRREGHERDTSIAAPVRHRGLAAQSCSIVQDSDEAQWLVQAHGGSQPPSHGTGGAQAVRRP